MNVIKEELKRAISVLIDEDKWSQLQRLVDAVESQSRNQSVIRKALDDASNIVSNG